MSWASSNQGPLWIKGKPGSGKSTLLKYAFGNQQAISSASNSDLVLFFFFHGRGDELQKTPLGFFRSLLHQILKQAPKALSDLVDTFEQKCKEIGDLPESWQWHPEELWQFFELSLPRILATRSVWLFVDALDECGDSNAKDLVRKFKSLLEMPTPPLTYSKQLRICFSCRHYPIVSSHDLFEICLEGENRADISTYVQSELSSFRELITPTISDLIIKRASGIFLWAQLVVRRVRDLGLQGEGEKKIMAAVRSIPEGLDELYNELIQGMGSTSLKLIQWICFATRPLSVDELRWAMAINADCQSLQACQITDDYVPDGERMKRQILKYSRGLAETTSGSGAQIVQFIHQSVKDFFTDKGGLMSTGAAIGMAHFQLSRTCIRYLAMGEIGQLTRYISGKMDVDFPFLSYAAASWITHTKESDARDISQEDLLELFAWPSNDLLNLWVRIYNDTEEYPKDFQTGGGSLLHIAARYQILGALNAIIRCAGQTTVCFDSEDRGGKTPLSWAAKEGHEAVVKLLFTTGQVDINSTDNLGQTPLSMAAEKGHEAVVKLFLATGQVEVDLKDDDSRTPLSWAAEKGHEAVIKLLLATGQAEVDSKDNFGRTPLSWAAEGGHEAVVKLLLATSQVEIDSKDEDGTTPLSFAVRNGHEAVIKLLLATGQVEIDSKDKHGRTPLLFAARNGHEAVVKLLLNTGQVEIDSKDEDGWTPLAWAARKRHEAVAKLLRAARQVGADGKDEDV
jgi:ankyrin repeat protein